MRSRCKLLVVILALAGCSKTGPADKVTYVDSNDTRMNAAIEKSRSTTD